MAFSREQRRNARTIITVGRSMGMSERDLLIGLMTSMQESSLRNLNYGHLDSLGLFQQRPSQGWGSRSQVTNPVYAARKFFSTLRGVKGRDNMALTYAAQAVQRSAFPTAYAQHRNAAQALLQSLGGSPIRTPGTPLRPPRQAPLGVNDPFPDNDHDLLGPGTAAETAPGASEMSAPGLMAQTPGTELFIAPGAGATDMPVDMPKNVNLEAARKFLNSANESGVSGLRAQIIASAKEFLGTPYVWGGEGPGGVDCSGLLYYIFRKHGIKNIPRVSYDQARWGKQTSIGDLVPGDFVAWDHGGPAGADHIALYLGNNRILEAARTGTNVRIRNLGKGEGAYGVHLNI